MKSGGGRQIVSRPRRVHHAPFEVRFLDGGVEDQRHRDGLAADSEVDLTDALAGGALVQTAQR